MSKLLIAEILVVSASITAFLISRFDQQKTLFWVGTSLGVLAGIMTVVIKVAADRRKREICIEKRPKDWFVDKTEWWNTHLEIESKEHGKGSNLNVRWEFFGYEKPELDCIVSKGNITIKYKRNNYPLNPKMPLRIYISGR